MKDQIEQRFRRNLERVQALVELYRSIGPVREGGAGGGGYVPVHQTDVLRAAVVFLHATLEDVVRSALEWKLPGAAPEHLEDVVLLGCERRGKFTLADLARHRGKTVDAVLAASVTAGLAESNFNHPGDLEKALLRIQVDVTATLDPHRGTLAPLMKRRHWIVHRADRNDEPGSGQHLTRSLRAATVENWQDAVESFGSALLGAL